MNRSSVDAIKRKAVWGARVLPLCSALFLMLGTSQTFAAGPHARKASHSMPGVPSPSVKRYKLDEKGNGNAAELLKSTQTKKGLKVAVEGTVKDDTISVTKLTELTEAIN